MRSNPDRTNLNTLFEHFISTVILCASNASFYVFLEIFISKTSIIAGLLTLNQSKVHNLESGV